MQRNNSFIEKALQSCQNPRLKYPSAPILPASISPSSSAPILPASISPSSSSKLNISSRE
uniref:Uncharacterized protein n=1 Tax=Salix viminalis TaxID=40686 RepID=A0A6N2NES3_SALVM